MSESSSVRVFTHQQLSRSYFSSLATLLEDFLGLLIELTKLAAIFGSQLGMSLGSYLMHVSYDKLCIWTAFILRSLADWYLDW